MEKKKTFDTVEIAASSELLRFSKKTVALIISVKTGQMHFQTTIIIINREEKEPLKKKEDEE